MDQREKPWLKRVLFDSWELKLAALVLAVISWYAVRDAISFEMLLNDVKLDVQLREGMAILNQTASTVDVSFSGSQDDIQHLDSKHIRAAIDLRTYDRSATVDVALKPHMIEGTRGVTVIDIMPQRIRFTLDREEEKIVPVKGRVTGHPLVGEVETVVCQPAMVSLRGPGRQLRMTEMVMTTPIDVEGRVASFVKRVPLIPPGDNWVAKINPPEVQVSVNIAGKAAERSLERLTVAAINAPGELKRIAIVPTQVDLTLKGSSEELKVIDDASVRAFADCTGLRAGEYELPVQVFLPRAGAVSASAKPPVVKVVIQ